LQQTTPHRFASLSRGPSSGFTLPRISESTFSRQPSSEVGTISERILSLLSSSDVRKGSLEQMQFGQCRSQFLRVIDHCVQTDRPVQLTLMAFPFKVPNPAKVGARRLPDLAELAALLRLHQLNLKAKLIHPAGLQFHIIHDGSYIAAVFAVCPEEVRAYENYFASLADLVNGLAPEGFLYLHDFQSLLSAHVGDLRRPISGVRESIETWFRNAERGDDWTDRFSKTLGMINLRDLPLAEASLLLDFGAAGGLPPEYSRLEHRVRSAMRRYCLRDSLLHAFDPRPICFPDAIHLTTQCRPQRLAIWMIGRGRSLLPWHGVGVIDSAGTWKVGLARDVVSDPSYQPVFMHGEDTPFFYQQRA
jgi:Pyoverdine/dityrosine biosynthesis protein